MSVDYVVVFPVLFPKKPTTRVILPVFHHFIIKELPLQDIADPKCHDGDRCRTPVLSFRRNRILVGFHQWKSSPGVRDKMVRRLREVVCVESFECTILPLVSKFKHLPQTPQEAARGHMGSA